MVSLLRTLRLNKQVDKTLMLKGSQRITVLLSLNESRWQNYYKKTRTYIKKTYPKQRGK